MLTHALSWLTVTQSQIHTHSATHPITPICSVAPSTGSHWQEVCAHVPSWATHTSHARAPSHPSGLQPLCRAGSGCHRGCRSTLEDKGSRKRFLSGHSDPHSDRAHGCTSLPASAEEAHRVSTQGPPEITLEFSENDGCLLKQILFE